MRRVFGAMLAAILAAGIAGCVAGEPGVQPTTQAASSTPPGGPCPEEVCGSNSPVIDLVGFHELNLFGVANREGFAIGTYKGVAQIVQRQIPYDLHVDGGVITGTRAGFPTLAGPALVGAAIPIYRGTSSYELVIRGVRSMTYFRGANTVPPPAPFEAYTLAYRPVGKDGDLSLCDNIQGLVDQAAADPEQSQLDLMGLTAVESVVFEGDRIDTRRKRMSSTADDAWFNIGCAGHTLAKLFLTRNTIHSQDAGLSRAWEQRQATMKLLVADYCGTGTSFTVFGQKLVWQGDAMTFFRPPRVLEARWNEKGAQCLYAPRMLFPTTSLGRSLFPDIFNQIAAVCQPAKCPDIDPYDFAGADRVSANP